MLGSFSEETSSILAKYEANLKQINTKELSLVDRILRLLYLTSDEIAHAPINMDGKAILSERAIGFLIHFYEDTNYELRMFYNQDRYGDTPVAAIPVDRSYQDMLIQILDKNLIRKFVALREKGSNDFTEMQKDGLHTYFCHLSRIVSACKEDSFPDWLNWQMENLWPDFPRSEWSSQIEDWKERTRFKHASTPNLKFLADIIAKSKRVPLDLDLRDRQKVVWDVSATFATSRGSLYANKCRNVPLHDCWAVARRHPEMAISAGVEAGDDYSFYIGDDDFVNSHLDACMGTKWENRLRFLDFYPEGYTADNPNLTSKSYIYSAWYGLGKLREGVVVLGGGSRIWFHDRFAHLLGQVFVGLRPEILDRYLRKVEFIWQLREQLVAKGLYAGEVEAVVQERSEEVFRIFDYATGNTIAVLGSENPHELPADLTRFKGFALMAGPTPNIYNFKRPFRSRKSLYIRKMEEYTDTRTMAAATLAELAGKGVDDNKVLQLVRELGEEYFVKPLNMEEIRWQFLHGGTEL